MFLAFKKRYTGMMEQDIAHDKAEEMCGVGIASFNTGKALNTYEHTSEVLG